MSLYHPTSSPPYRLSNFIYPLRAPVRLSKPFSIAINPMVPGIRYTDLTEPYRSLQLFY